jgi:hypothetical protein
VRTRLDQTHVAQKRPKVLGDVQLGLGSIQPLGLVLFAPGGLICMFFSFGVFGRVGWGIKPGLLPGVQGQLFADRV